MKNRTLSISRRSIPYIKELRKITGSVTASILMQQLDYWFDERGGNPFYKFLEPCAHQKYKKDDSWCEELGFSPDEFRNAFSKIGVAYKSVDDFDKAKSNGTLFQRLGGADGGAPVGVVFYCYVIDKVNHMTYYHRNHEYVDSALDRLVSGDIGIDRGGHLGNGKVGTLANPTSYIGTESTRKTETKEEKKEKEKKDIPFRFSCDGFETREEKNQYAKAIDFYADDDVHFYDIEVFRMFKEHETTKIYKGNNPKYQGLILKFLSEEKLNTFGYEHLENYTRTAPECALYEKYTDLVNFAKAAAYTREQDAANFIDPNAETEEGPLDHERN